MAAFATLSACSRGTTTTPSPSAMTTSPRRTSTPLSVIGRYRLDLTASRTEASPHALVVRGHFMVDDLIAVGEAAAGDNTTHAALLLVADVG